MNYSISLMSIMKLCSTALLSGQGCFLIYFLWFEYRRWEGSRKRICKAFNILTTFLNISIIISGIFAAEQAFIIIENPDSTPPASSLIGTWLFSYCASTCHVLLLYIRSKPLIEDSPKVKIALLILVGLDAAASLVGFFAVLDPAFQYPGVATALLNLVIDVFCTWIFYSRYKQDEKTFKDQKYMTSRVAKRTVAITGLLICLSSFVGTIASIALYLNYVEKSSQVATLSSYYIMQCTGTLTSCLWMFMKIRNDKLSWEKPRERSKINHNAQERLLPSNPNLSADISSSLKAQSPLRSRQVSTAKEEKTAKTQLPILD
jgi:hypothetical protein